MLWFCFQLSTWRNHRPCLQVQSWKCLSWGDQDLLVLFLFLFSPWWRLDHNFCKICDDGWKKTRDLYFKISRGPPALLCYCSASSVRLGELWAQFCLRLTVWWEALKRSLVVMFLVLVSRWFSRLVVQLNKACCWRYRRKVFAWWWEKQNYLFFRHLSSPLLVLEPSEFNSWYYLVAKYK